VGRALQARFPCATALRDRSKDRYAYPAKLRITLAP